MPGTLQIAYLLQRAHGPLFRAINRLFKTELGITAAQQGVLLILAVKDGQPISTIAHTLNMSKSSLTGLIDRMSESGLVIRKPDAQDGRIQKVYLQRRGKKLIAAATPIVERLNREFLAPFEQDEQQVIKNFLLSIARNAETVCATQNSRNNDLAGELK